MSSPGEFGRPIPEVPTPNYDDTSKEVFTFFGLALYAAHVLERELINFIVVLKPPDVTACCNCCRFSATVGSG